MSSGFDPQLLLAIVIVVGALALFAWRVVAATRRAGQLFSGPGVSRWQVLLGVPGGLVIIYLLRR